MAKHILIPSWLFPFNLGRISGVEPELLDSQTSVHSRYTILSIKLWCSRRDSNSQPHPPQGCASASWATRAKILGSPALANSPSDINLCVSFDYGPQIAICFILIWWAERDLNSQSRRQEFLRLLCMPVPPSARTLLLKIGGDTRTRTEKPCGTSS